MLIYPDNETEYNPGFSLEETALKVAEHILKKEGCPFECEINLTITDDEEIRSVNKEYREIDASTDVLSFPAFDFAKPGDFSFYESEEYRMNLNPDTGNFMLGDIMISSEHVISQAKEYGHSELREFAFLVAHSVLHLIGYDHMTEEDAKVMEEKQENYLSDLGIVRK